MWALQISDVEIYILGGDQFTICRKTLRYYSLFKYENM